MRGGVLPLGWGRVVCLRGSGPGPFLNTLSFIYEGEEDDPNNPDESNGQPSDGPVSEGGNEGTDLDNIDENLDGNVIG